MKNFLVGFAILMFWLGFGVICATIIEFLYGNPLYIIPFLIVVISSYYIGKFSLAPNYTTEESDKV